MGENRRKKNRAGYADDTRNIKLILAYDGSGYSGWQRLGTGALKPSIQDTIETCLARYLKETVKITGSGRTDAGVHALGQTANFHCHSKETPESMKINLNQILPADIRILKAEEVPHYFHCRYMAKRKIYEYRINTREVQSVFLRKYTCHMPGTFRYKAMEQAAGFLIGTHDFKAFSTDRKDGKSTVRTVEAISITNYKDARFGSPTDELRIGITGDGFLYNMVRIIVGTLAEVGLGQIAPQEMNSILAGRSRQNAGKTIGPEGLYLKEVIY